MVYDIIRHMKRTTIFIDESLEKDVQAIARQRGVPVAQVVREAVAAYVTAERASTPLSFIAAGSSGRSDTAARHEELLWTSPHADDVPARALRANRSGSRPPRRRS